MNTVKTQLKHTLFEEITVLNGENTEESLNMEIANIIFEEKAKRIKKSNIIMDGEVIGELLELADCIENEVYVFSNCGVKSLVFDKYSSIEDAVKAAVKIIDAKIICKGKVIRYDTLSDTEAFYVDEDDTVRLVEID